MEPSWHLPRAHMPQPQISGIGIASISNGTKNQDGPRDAQSAALTVGDTSSTMMLLGMAMLAVEGLRRRFLR